MSTLTVFAQAQEGYVYLAQSDGATDYTEHKELVRLLGESFYEAPNVLCAITLLSKEKCRLAGENISCLDFGVSLIAACIEIPVKCQYVLVVQQYFTYREEGNTHVEALKLIRVWLKMWHQLGDKQ
jgi:hypothetical protein